MANNTRASLEKRAQKTIIEHALFRWESAVIIALTLLLTAAAALSFIDIAPFWVWLIGGLVGEGALVYSSITDSEANQELVAQMLRREYNLDEINDDALRVSLYEAMDYHGRIAAAIQERGNSVLKDTLHDTAEKIDEWVEYMFNLAKRIDAYKTEMKRLNKRDKRVHNRMHELRQQLQNDPTPAVRADIERSIASMEKQLQTNRNIADTMKRAELRLEQTLTALGTLYSQTMLIGAKNIDNARAQRLREDISEEVTGLDDILLAMDEVYASEDLFSIE